MVERAEIISRNEHVSAQDEWTLCLINLSNLVISDDMKSVLLKGSKFVPTYFPSLGDLYMELKMFIRKLYLKVYFQNCNVDSVNNLLSDNNLECDDDDELLNLSIYDYENADFDFEDENVVNVENIENVESYNTGYGKLLLPYLTSDSKFTPNIKVPAIATFFKVIFREMTLIMEKFYKNQKQYNLNKSEWMALKNMIKIKREFIFKCADKGGN